MVGRVKAELADVLKLGAMGLKQVKLAVFGFVVSDRTVALDHPLIASLTLFPV